MDAAFAESASFRRAASEVARRVGGRGARVVRASATPLAHRVIRETTAALFRVALRVERAGGAPATDVSLVVKRMQADSPSAFDPGRARFLPSDHPLHPNYWRREYDAFGSRLLDELPVPLRAPVCYAREIESRVASVWLEDVASASPDTWSDERFFTIARALGTWQRAHVATDGDAARPAWLARGSLRMWSPAAGGSAHAAAFRDDLFASSRAERTFGGALRDRVRAFWHERDALLEALERVPQTFAHNDFWTRNLLADASRGDVVVIDWSELGIAPFAHDLVNLVLDSVWMFDVSPQRLPALEAAVLSGYGEGWQAAGGSDARAAIDDAYRANARLRMGSLAGSLLSQAADERKRALAGERYGRAYEEVFETRAAMIRAAFRR